MEQGRVYLSGDGLFVSVDAKPSGIDYLDYFIVGDTLADLTVGFYVSPESGAKLRAFIQACNKKEAVS